MPASPSINRSFYNDHKEIDRLRNHAGVWATGAAVITTIALAAIATSIVYAVRTHSKLYLLISGPAFAALPITIPLWVKSFYIQKNLSIKRTELIETMAQELRNRKKLKKKWLLKYIEEDLLKDAGLRSSKTLLLGELIKKFPKDDKDDKDIPRIHKSLNQAKINLGKELEDLAEE